MWEAPDTEYGLAETIPSEMSVWLRNHLLTDWASLTLLFFYWGGPEMGKPREHRPGKDMVERMEQTEIHAYTL